jgi:hypothetical protein
MRISLPIAVLLLLGSLPTYSQSCDIASLEKLIKAQATEYYKGGVGDQYYTMPVKLDYEKSSKTTPDNIASERFIYAPGQTLRFYLAAYGMDGDRLIGRLYKYDKEGRHKLIKEFYGSKKVNEITFVDYKTESEDELKLDICFENGSKGCGLLIMTMPRL